MSKPAEYVLTKDLQTKAKELKKEKSLVTFIYSSECNPPDSWLVLYGNEEKGSNMKEEPKNKTMYAVIETMQMHDHRVVALFEDYDKAKKFANKRDYYYVDEIPVLG